MPNMNAAVVTSFDEPPHYQQFQVPQPTASEELLVDVLAVGCTRAYAAAPPVPTTPAAGRCR